DLDLSVAGAGPVLLLGCGGRACDGQRRGSQGNCTKYHGVTSLRVSSGTTFCPGGLLIRSGAVLRGDSPVGRRPGQFRLHLQKRIPGGGGRHVRGETEALTPIASITADMASGHI